MLKNEGNARAVSANKDASVGIYNRQWLVWEVILTAMLFIQKAFHHRVGFGNPESLQVWGSVEDSVPVCSPAVPDEIWFQRKPLDRSSL